MSREKEPAMLIDLSDVAAKRQLIENINLRSGLHEVSIRPRRFKRSNNQNSYYWAAFIPPWLAWLRREEGDPSITAEQAHIALKCVVLGTRAVTNKTTGLVIEVPPTTHDMNTEEFSIYLDLAGKFLAEFAGIVVLPSEMFYEKAA